MTDTEIAYWDAEAIDDPRYANANWGMTSADDGRATIARITNIVQAALPRRFARVLEIGCGPCRLLLPLAKANPDADFYGRDISPEMLWIAKRRISNAMTKNIYVGNEMAHAGMDVVYVVELMQHLDDDAAVNIIWEAAGAIRHGGTFIAQFVTQGESAPHSWPRTEDKIRSLYEKTLWGPLTFTHRDDIHRHWVWVSTTKR